MKKTMELQYRQCSLNELEVDEQVLVKEAQNACLKAYATYSHFSVGAAVQLRSGKILHGANSESEVFPSGICAERSVLYYTEANYPDDPIVSLAITSIPSERECYPCGACRQVILDVQRRQNSPIKIIMAGKDTASIVDNAEFLLPFTFQLD